MTASDDPTRTPADAAAQARRLAEAGDLDAAASVCVTALQTFGDDPALLRLLGAVRHRAGRNAEAAEVFRKLTAATPEDAEAWAGLGLVLASAERTEDAVAALTRAFELDPAHPAAGRNLALTLMKMRRPAEAARVYRRLVAAAPADPELLGWLGHALAASDDAEGAAEAYRAALGNRPGDRNLTLTLALVERDLGDIAASIARFDRLIAEKPDDAVARFSQAQNRLLTGDFPAGFADYEWRWRRPGMERPALPGAQWAGEPLDGRSILLHDEQGLGDTIQFCRFAAAVKRRGARVGLMVRPRLRRLLSRLDGVDAPVEEETAAAGGWEFHAPLMSLPRLLGVTADTIPADIPYLAPEPALVERWRPVVERAARTGAERPLKVGLVWQGDPNSQSERGRSPPFAALAPLFDCPGVHLFLLQKEAGREALAGLGEAPGVTDLGPGLDTGADAFVDTAAVMSLLDVVVTSDTAPAHLAGALGLRCFTLLKRVPEWRWMLERDDSPWYPTMRLFRQRTRGDWQDPVREARAALEALRGRGG